MILFILQLTLFPGLTAWFLPSPVLLQGAWLVAPGLYSVWLYSTRCSSRLQEPNVCSQRVFDRVGVATYCNHQRGMSDNSTTGVSSKHMDRHSTSKLRCVYYAVFILIICAFVLLSIDNYEFFFFASVTVI